MNERGSSGMDAPSHVDQGASIEAGTPGFEPGPTGLEPVMLGRYTTSLRSDRSELNRHRLAHNQRLSR